MTVIAAVKTGPQRWSGPEWSRHIAGKAMAERDSKRAAPSWLEELARLYPPS